MRECGQVLAEWRISRVIDEHAPRESTRISSKDTYGLAGSATGEEAIALLKANKDEKAATIVDVTAKKDDVDAKKARDTSSRVIVGAVFFDNIK